MSLGVLFIFLFREYGQCRTAVLCAEPEFAIHEIGLIHLKNKSSSSSAYIFFVWGPELRAARQLLLFKHSANTPTWWPGNVIQDILCEV